MERLERIEHPIEAIRTALEGSQAAIWTTLPGIVQSFDPTEMTVTVQPTIQMQQTDRATNTKSLVNLPILLDVPIMIQSGGGLSLTFPIKVGDECLVSFASRCIDAWWQQGGIQPQAEFRMHDLSDGFAFIGPRSLPRVISNYNTVSVELRTDDGLSFIRISPKTHNIGIASSNNVTVTSTGAVTLNATGGVTINGALTVNGNILTTGTLTNNGHAVGSTHTHTGVTSGSGISGVPV